MRSRLLAILILNACISRDKLWHYLTNKPNKPILFMLYISNMLYLFPWMSSLLSISTPKARSGHIKWRRKKTYLLHWSCSEQRRPQARSGFTSTSEKYILNGISGSASPGSVVALMGGCGKTSLLGILVGRISNNVVEGSITYNDEIKNKSLKRRQWITFIQPEGRSYFNL